MQLINTPTDSAAIAAVVAVEEGGGGGNYGGTSTTAGVGAGPPSGVNIPLGVAQSKPQPRPVTPEEKQQGGSTEKTLPGPAERSISLSSVKDSIPESTPPVHSHNPHLPTSPSASTSNSSSNSNGNAKEAEPQPPVSATTF